jgi:hypothetical protein
MTVARWLSSLAHSFLLAHLGAAPRSVQPTVSNPRPGFPPLPTIQQIFCMQSMYLRFLGQLFLFLATMSSLYSTHVSGRRSGRPAGRCFVQSLTQVGGGRSTQVGGVCSNAGRSRTRTKFLTVCSPRLGWTRWEIRVKSYGCA